MATKIGFAAIGLFAYINVRSAVAAAAPCVKFAICCTLYAPAVPAGLNLNLKGSADNSISRASKMF